MIIELKAEHRKVLERAAQSGMRPEEVLDQAFAVIHEQFSGQDWIAANRDTMTAQIEEGLAQAQRGELIEGEETIQILQERRAKRHVA